MNARAIATLALGAIAIGKTGVWVGQQAYTWLPPQASAESILVDDLFSFLVTIGTMIFLGVTGVLVYSVLFQQAGKYDTSDGPPIEGNWTLEIVWTAIPFALVVWIAFYSYQVYDRMGITGGPHAHHGGGMGMPAAEAATVPAVAQSEPVERIEVRSRQWAWEFRYPDRNVTSTELHLPRDRRIQFDLQSEDVIHGFYIPAFRLKQDIVPNESMNFELTPIRDGTYRLRDSLYSGTYFAAMQADVVVESPEAYEAWLAAAAAQSPRPAYNRAYAEYRQSQEKAKKEDGTLAGWETIEPAAPPIVNYTGAIPENSPKRDPANNG
ncbi:MAG: cytochrome c oxidase subunit II [Cyanobacteria bacterium J06641_5]